MTTCDFCLRWDSVIESIMHNLQDCEEGTEFWNSIVRPGLWTEFFSLGLHAWLDRNLTNDNIGNIP